MMLDWFSKNYIWLVSIFVQGVIAYHVFFLSKKLSEKSRLEHKEKIKKSAEELLLNIRRDRLNRKVYLVNINRYFKDYPRNDEKLFDGYSHIGAEIKATRFDGIEFFIEVVEIYKKPSGELSFKGDNAEKKLKAFAVGIVPYEWIEYVDLQGDEYGFVPLFYCYFKGRRYWKFWKHFLWWGYPYERIIYYRESGVYHEGSDPLDMKYRIIDQPISKK